MTNYLFFCLQASYLWCLRPISSKVFQSLAVCFGTHSINKHAVNSNKAKVCTVKNMVDFWWLKNLEGILIQWDRYCGAISSIIWYLHTKKVLVLVFIRKYPLISSPDLHANPQLVLTCFHSSLQHLLILVAFHCVTTHCRESFLIKVLYFWIKINAVSQWLLKKVPVDFVPIALFQCVFWVAITFFTFVLPCYDGGRPTTAKYS